MHWNRETIVLACMVLRMEELIIDLLIEIMEDTPGNSCDEMASHDTAF